MKLLYARFIRWFGSACILFGDKMVMRSALITIRNKKSAVKRSPIYKTSLFKRIIGKAKSIFLRVPSKEKLSQCFKVDFQNIPNPVTRAKAYDPETFGINPGELDKIMKENKGVVEESVKAATDLGLKEYRRKESKSRPKFKGKSKKVCDKEIVTNEEIRFETLTKQEETDTWAPLNKPKAKKERPSFNKPKREELVARVNEVLDEANNTETNSLKQ